MKYRALLLTLSLLLFLSGCGEPELRHKVDATHFSTEAYTKILSDLIIPDNQPLKEVVYPEDELLFDFRPNHNLQNLFYGRCFGDPSYVFAYYPTENVRHIKTPDTEYYYAVFNTDTGSRVFLFFDRNGMPYGYPICMKEVLSQVDFASIHPGSPVEDVISIDPATETYVRHFPVPDSRGVEEMNQDLASRFLENGSYDLTSVHLLRDCLIEIRYEFSEEGYRVKEIFTEPDFTRMSAGEELFEWPDYNLWAPEDHASVKESYQSTLENYQNNPYHYAILEQDYVQ